MPQRNRKQNANPKDRRHENGLAPPGKQIKKQRSITNLNGDGNGNAIGETPSPSRSTTPSFLNADHCGSNAMHLASSPHSGSLDDLSRFPAGGSSGESPSSYNFDSANIDLQVLKSESYPSSGYTDISTTIIERRSIKDVFAILLLLFQLHPHILTVVQLGFCFLTLGLSFDGFTLATLTTSFDWLNLARGDSPSLLVTIVIDLGAFISWLLIPLMAKNIILDLAQSVIATSLVGSSEVVGKYHWFVCSYVTGIFYCLEHEPHRDISNNILFMLLTKYGIPPFELPSSSRLWKNPLIPRTKFRTLLEVHIVTQGIVRFIRRWISRPKQKDNDVQLSQPHNLNLGNNESTSEGGRNNSTDGRPPGLPPTARDGKERLILSSKKKRKQANFVRSQQPFWAAIANTKITLKKEYEQVHAVNDTQDAQASDDQHLGNADYRCLDDQVWISQVYDAEAWFAASLTDISFLEDSPSDQSSQANEAANQDAYHIQVRVNGANWTSIVLVNNDFEGGRILVSGKIFGLTASMNYLVDFIRTMTGKTVLSTSMVTRPISSSDEHQVLPSKTPQSLRPLSPRTTLRNSIAAQETIVNEARARYAKVKQNRKKVSIQVKSAVDSLENRLESFGSKDGLSRRRQQQLNENIRKAESSTTELSSELDKLSELPIHDIEASSKVKQIYVEEGQNHRKLLEDNQKSKTEADRATISVRNEKAGNQQRRERLQGRLNKLTTQHEALSVGNGSSREQKNVRRQEIQSRLDELRAHEQSLVVSIDSYVSSRDSMNSQMYQAELIMNYPQTPESAYAIMAGSNNRAPPGFSGFGTLPNPSGTPIDRRGSLTFGIQGNGRARGRSSSMLSDVSGYTDDQLVEVQTTSPSNGNGKHQHGKYQHGQSVSNGNGSPVSKTFEVERKSPHTPS